MNNSNGVQYDNLVRLWFRANRSYGTHRQRENEREKEPDN